MFMDLTLIKAMYTKILDFIVPVSGTSLGKGIESRSRSIPLSSETWH
jgi:hypothetical protein